jgi:hypothetical protein
MFKAHLISCSLVPSFPIVSCLNLGVVPLLSNWFTVSLRDSGLEIFNELGSNFFLLD